jgi:sugar lactone lactonase YvrE
MMHAPRHLVSVVLCGAALSLNCAGPLPPENPKTEPDVPATPAPIKVDSTQPVAPLPSAASEPHLATPPRFVNVGLQTPESVLYEPTNDIYLVSNINGSPVEKDNNGFISQLNPDGTVKNLKFISGGTNGVELNAPKGLLIIADTLYVTDIDHVRKFDLASGAAKGYVHFPKATFLNDLAVDAAGALYVSDSGVSPGKAGMAPNGSAAIYKLEGEKISLVVKGKPLPEPNGLLVENGSVLFLTFNANTVNRLDAKGKISQTAQLPTGELDGFVALEDGTWLISSWQGKQVYRGNFSQPFEVVASELESPADIGFDSKRRRILVPLFLKNEVRTVDLPAGTSAASTSSAASSTSAVSSGAAAPAAAGPTAAAPASASPAKPAPKTP